MSSFADVSGWQLEVLTDSAKRTVGAVWTGTLASQQFVEFPLVAENPKTEATVPWPAFQTCTDGERVEWTGAEGVKTPASVTSIGPPSDGGLGAGSTRWVPWRRWESRS